MYSIIYIIYIFIILYYSIVISFRIFEILVCFHIYKYCIYNFKNYKHAIAT